MAADAPSHVQVDVEPRETGAVARVTIDNAARLNIIGSALMADFVAKVTALGAREDLRAVVLPARAGGPSSAAPISARWRSSTRRGRANSSPGCTACARRCANFRCR